MTVERAGGSRSGWPAGAWRPLLQKPHPRMHVRYSCSAGAQCHVRPDSLEWVSDKAFSHCGCTCRVAGWRADQGRINQPGHGSTPPPINRTAGFPQSGWKSKLSVAAFPILPSLYLGERSVRCNLQRWSGSWRQPECVISTRTLSFSNACPLPETLCSDGLLSPSSLLLRPLAPVSRPPTNFPGKPVISPALRTRHLPRFDHASMSWCRHPYAGRPPECMYPSSSSGALAFACLTEARHLRSHSGLEHSFAGALGGRVFRRCSVRVMLRPQNSLASWSTDLDVSAGPPRLLHPGFRFASHLLEAPDNATAASWATPRVGLPPTGHVMVRAARKAFPLSPDEP